MVPAMRGSSCLARNRQMASACSIVFDFSRLCQRRSWAERSSTGNGWHRAGCGDFFATNSRSSLRRPVPWSPSTRQPSYATELFDLISGADQYSMPSIRRTLEHVWGTSGENWRNRAASRTHPGPRRGVCPKSNNQSCLKKANTQQSVLGRTDESGALTQYSMTSRLSE